MIKRNGAIRASLRRFFGHFVGKPLLLVNLAACQWRNNSRKPSQKARGSAVSETDSFIEEVSEEVKRDKLFALMRRYGWIAVLLVILLVGGAAYNEYRKAQNAATAQAFGDAILNALELDQAERAAALSQIEAPNASGNAVLQLLAASEEGASGDDAAAAARLQTVVDDPEVPMIYREIASFKALSRSDSGLDVETRRSGLNDLAIAGKPLRLLAEEQLALLEIETGDTDAALERLQRLLEDSEVTVGLRRRASQLIIALGGEPISG